MLEHILASPSFALSRLSSLDFQRTVKGVIWVIWDDATKKIELLLFHVGWDTLCADSQVNDSFPKVLFMLCKSQVWPDPQFV